MSRFAFTQGEIDENLRLIQATSRQRLKAHNPGGFSPIYFIRDDDILAEAVEQPTFNTPDDALDDLARIIKINLTRLFQLAVHFDDHMPRDQDEKPSPRLLTILKKEWGVDVEGLTSDHVYEILCSWYQRHLDWWKVDKRSKRQFEKDEDILLVSLLEEYRVSRRSGTSRRERESEPEATVKQETLPSIMKIEPSLAPTPTAGSSAQLTLENQDTLVKEEPAAKLTNEVEDPRLKQARLFVSACMAWKVINLFYAASLYKRVIPVHPADVHRDVSEELNLEECETVIDDVITDEFWTYPNLMKVSCESYKWFKNRNKPGLDERYRALPEHMVVQVKYPRIGRDIGYDVKRPEVETKKKSSTKGDPEEDSEPEGKDEEEQMEDVEEEAEDEDEEMEDAEYGTHMDVDDDKQQENTNQYSDADDEDQSSSDLPESDDKDGSYEDDSDHQPKAAPRRNSNDYRNLHVATRTTRRGTQEFIYEGV